MRGDGDSDPRVRPRRGRVQGPLAPRRAPRPHSPVAGLPPGGGSFAGLAVSRTAIGWRSSSRAPTPNNSTPTSGVTFSSTSPAIPARRREARPLSPGQCETPFSLLLEIPIPQHRITLPPLNPLPPAGGLLVSKV